MTLASAFFVNPHPPESEGVDYLGLRAINLSMMDVMLPGINNVVDMIRPFTLMSWIAWRFENGAEGWPTVSTADFMRFQQKVETVFAFSHVNENDAVGLPGRQQKVPPGDVIRFQFAEFKRAGSILDAALYGPAIKSLSGLGFLASPDGKFLKVTPSGRKLALVLDALLQEHLSNEQYEFISSLDVSADVKLTHCAGVKVTHLGEDGGLLAVDVDPGASSGDTCDGPQGRGDQGNSQAAWLLAQHRAAVLA